MSRGVGPWLLLLALWAGGAVAGGGGAQTGGEAELATRLDELTRELRLMRAEMAQLRQAVAEIHRATIQTPARAAAPAVRHEVALGGGPVLGAEGAPAAIVEFSDFQCPFCRRFHDQTFAELRRRYIDTGKIRYALRNYPLGFHPEAGGAAIAAHCAGEQGGFWEMKDALFANQRRLGPDLYRSLAASLGLDGARFEACLDAPESRAVVERDLDQAERAGVSGTPSFFIGRVEGDRVVQAVRISGAQPLASFERALEPLIAQ